MQLTGSQQKAIDQLGFLPEEGAYRVGPHTIVVGDLEDPLVVEVLEQFGPWDVCWVDPPWGTRIGNAFRRQAEVGGLVDIERLYGALGDVLGWVRDAALVWTNDELKPLGVGALYVAGFERSLEARVTYGRFTHPTPITVGARGNTNLETLKLDGLHGGRAIAEAFLGWYRELPGRKGASPATELPDTTSHPHPLHSPSSHSVRLVDPFCGQDVLASLADDCVHVTGAEIHRGRAAVTLARLAKLTKKEPKAA